MSGRRTHPGPTPSSETSLERDRESGIAYFAEVPRDDESRPRTRWSEPPPNLGDPPRDVTGALHDVSNALTVLLGWVAEARATRSPEHVDRALAIVEGRARVPRDGAHQIVEGLLAVVDDRVGAPRRSGEPRHRGSLGRG